MQSTELYFFAMLIILSIAVVFYWAMPARRGIVVERPLALSALIIVTLAGFVLSYVSLSGETAEYTYDRQENPLAIAIAFDLSPSMLAIPHPASQENVAPRYVRGKAVIRDFLRHLEDNGEVWRNGTQVGLVEVAGNGDVWIGGSKDGAVEPYAQEWKRAAIVFFFSDVFNDPG